MRLTGKKMLLISFMLFSLFFGAGNLIFPPFLGQNAGSQTIPAMIGFLVTAVILPILGVLHSIDLSVYWSRAWHSPCSLRSV